MKISRRSDQFKGRAFPFLLCVAAYLILSIAAKAQNCSTSVPSDWVTIYVSGRMQSGSTADQIRNWMRNHTKSQLDSAVRRADACDSEQFVNWRFQADRSQDYIFVAKYENYCSSIRNFLICNQRTGWPQSKPDEQQASPPTTPKKKEVSGADILLSDLNQQATKGPNDAALEQIDTQEDALGCYQKGPEDPACHDLELRRSNLLNNKPEMQGVSSTTVANPASSLNKKTTTETSPRTTSIDTDSGMSAAQCVSLTNTGATETQSGDRNECLIVKDGHCYYKTVTLTFQNKCKRAVQSSIDWGGRAGYVSVGALSSAQTSCQVTSGKSPGYPKVNCSPGTLTNQQFQ